MFDYINMLRNNLDPFSIRIEDRILTELVEYMRCLFEFNQKTNLTSITDWEEAIIKHIVDSLLIIRTEYWKNAKNILDVGSGAGFPGIPLLLTDRGKHLVLIEANKKKVQFLKFVKEQFGLDQLVILSDRAETIAHEEEYREKFDLVLARALASLPTLLELTLPFCREGGVFVAYKGPEIEKELIISENALKKLGAEYEAVQPYLLPKNKGKRNLLFFLKNTKTPVNYPRRPGIPGKRPIM